MKTASYQSKERPSTALSTVLGPFGVATLPSKAPLDPGPFAAVFQLVRQVS